jgi:hypothetical protein
MSQIVRTIFIITGPLARQTIMLGDHSMPFHFVDGRFELVATEDDTQKIAHYLKNSWQVYPETEVAHGISNIQKDEEPELKQDETIPSGVLSQLGTVETNDVGYGSAGTQDGDTRVLSEGNGQKEKLTRVLGSLDKSNDALWTADGKPTVSAVSMAIGGNVSRAEIEATLPGFQR